MQKTSKKTAKKIIALIACMLILPIVLTGCMPYEELKSESIVEGMGIDYGDNGYNITFQIYNPKSGGGGGGGDNGKNSTSSTVTILQCSGASLFDAVRNATLQNGRKLYFSNTRAYVVGEEVCKENFNKVLDFMERNQQIRPSDHIYIAKGKAADVMLYQKDGEIVPAVNLQLMSENNVQTSKVEEVQLFDIFKNTATGCTDSTISAIAIKEENNGEKTLEMDGSAVLHNNHFAGYLDDKETRGCLWIKSKAQGGVLILNLPEGGTASMEIIKSSSKVSFSGDEKTPAVTVDISFHTNLVELQSQENYTIDGSFLSNLKKIQEDTVKAEAQAAIDKALKDYDSDVFGFGVKIFQNRPDIWHKIGSEWNQNAKNTKVEIKVDSIISHIGLTNQTA
jgi:spore germination protein KC